MPEILAECQKRAWGALLVAHAAAHRAIDAALRSEGLPSLEVYDVLLALEDAPQQRLRMVDLAEAVIYSPSGLTRLIDRMEKNGLVARHACPSDRRAIHVAITPEGLAAREGAWPRYSRLIQEHFGKYLTDGEARNVAESLHKVIGGEKFRRRCPDS